jgi:vancomycin resistance protein YoaR
MKRTRPILFFALFLSGLLFVPEAAWSFQEKKEPEVRLMVRFGEKEWNLDLREIGFDGIDPTTLNQDALMNQIHETIEKEVNRKPRSAYYKDRKVVPHQLGVKVDRQKIKLWFDEIHDYINRRVDLPVQWSMPTLTTNELLQLKEKELGSYTTFFNHRNVNRSHNIYLSAKAIDHHVLMPGETFSFNKVVGIRSRARGYRMAKIIVKGEYSEGVGGGICQTSSTLFNAVDMAGLEIVERNSHSRRVAYVPKNRDATVSWGGPDFKFKNSLSKPILIAANVKKGVLTIHIYAPRDARHFPREVPEPPGEKESIREEVKEKKENIG